MFSVKKPDVTSILRENLCWDWDSETKQKVPREAAARAALPASGEVGKPWYIVSEDVVVCWDDTGHQWVTTMTRPGLNRG